MMPIFMIGTQRSGSNLLRLMLNQLPEIAAPHPPHILQRIMPLVLGYGNLSLDENFKWLVEDVCRLVELNPVPWDGVVLDRANVAGRCRERNLVAVHGAVYDICAEVKGAKTWCCKSLANINFVPQIDAYFGKPRYIYLYRDGRDVAVSFRKAVVGEKHFYHIAREWAATQKLAIALRRKIDLERFLSISYEELTGDPQRTGRLICAFLGVPYRDSMLDYHRTDEAKRAATSSDLWVNVTSPVMKNNSRKYLREATEQDIRIFESMAGDVLDELGYERAFVRKGEESVFSEAEIKAFDAENARRKEDLRKLVDPADQIRRDLQDGLLKAVRERQAAGTTAVPKENAVPGARTERDGVRKENRTIR
jgi:hypothetical protein